MEPFVFVKCHPKDLAVRAVRFTEVFLAPEQHDRSEGPSCSTYDCDQDSGLYYPMTACDWIMVNVYALPTRRVLEWTEPSDYHRGPEEIVVKHSRRIKCCSSESCVIAHQYDI